MKKTLAIIFLLSASLFAQSDLKSRCSAVLQDLAGIGATIGIRVGRYNAGMPGGQSFASAWAVVSVSVKSEITALASAFQNVGLSSPVVTAYISGREPVSMSDVDRITAALRAMQVAAADEQR